MVDVEDVAKAYSTLLATGEFDFIEEKLTPEELYKLFFFVSYVIEAVKKEDEQ